MKIIKRNAVTKADKDNGERTLTDSQIEDIAEYVEFKCNKLNRAVSVEEIQDMVENQIMATGAFELARKYVRYRYKRSLVRKANTTDNRILSLIEYNNEDVKQENSNKNPAVNSVQRDYMAGQQECFSHMILWRQTEKESFTSMILTIMHSICITAILSIWRTCFRTEL